MKFGGYVKRLTDRYRYHENKKLYVCYIILHILVVLTAVRCLLTQNYDTDLIDYFKADSLNIISEQEIPWTFDGEYGGSWSTIHIENRKCSVQMILNRDKGHELPI